MVWIVLQGGTIVGWSGRGSTCVLSAVFSGDDKTPYLGSQSIFVGWRWQERSYLAHLRKSKEGLELSGMSVDEIGTWTSRDIRRFHY